MIYGDLMDTFPKAMCSSSGPHVSSNPEEDQSFANGSYFIINWELWDLFIMGIYDCLITIHIQANNAKIRLIKRWLRTVDQFEMMHFSDSSCWSSSIIGYWGVQHQQKQPLS